MLKKRYLFLVIFICLFAISAVGANEMVNETNNVLSVDTYDLIELNNYKINSELNSNLNESFMDLAIEIENADGELNLTSDYIFQDNDSKYKNGISINSQITIDGLGHIIDGENRASMFNINADDIILKNIRFNHGIAHDNSGAICWKGKNGIIINCTFESNSGAPGALLVSGANVIVINCTFKDNKLNSLHLGGAICWKGVNGTIINSTFTGTQSPNEGGAIFWSSKNAKIINCSFLNNNAWRGGAIAFGNIYGNSNNAQVINSTFIGNYDAQGGSAICNYGGNNITIDCCKFIKNRGTYGILNAGSNSLVHNCLFYMNTGFSSSSQTSALISAGNITNCIFLNNTAKKECYSIIKATNLDYNWFGNTYNDYNIAPNSIIGLKNWLFLNVTHERLMNVGEEMSVPFVFQVWNGITVLNYDSSKIYPFELNLSATNGKINKLFAVVGEDILYNAFGVGNGSITAKFFDRQLTIDLVSKKPTKLLVPDSITIFVDQIMNFANDTFAPILIPSEAGNLTYSTDNKTILNVNSTCFSGLNCGVANIIVEFEETDEYAPTKVLVPVNVLKYNTNIITNDSIVMDYNDFKIIEAQLTPTVGNFIYRIENKNIATISDEGVISSVGAGTTDINVFFEGNRKYYANNKTIKLIVNKIDSCIQFSKDIKFNYGKSDYTLTMVEGVVDIEAFVVDHPEAIININKNKITISGLDVGDYTLVVKTIPDNNHNSVNSTLNVIVSKTPTKITVTNEKIILKVNQEIDIGATLTPNNDINLNYSSSNTSVAKIVNGKIVAISKGTAIITVSFMGDDKYLPTESKSINVVVISNTCVGGDDLELFVGDKSAINSNTVPDNLKITYISNNPSVARVDSNGVVTAVGVGNCTVTLRVGDDIEYAKNSTFIKVSVKPSLSISAPEVIKYYHGSERFVVVIKDKNNPVVGGKVKIVINGIIYSLKTDSNGQASLAINLNSGVYDVTSEFEDIKIQSTIIVKSTILGKDISKIYKNGTQYYASFKDSNGNLLKNFDVNLNINGVFYMRTTNEQGIARLNINLNPGTYILTAQNPSTGEQHGNTIIVLPNIVENHDLTKYYRNNSQYYVRLIDDTGKPANEGVNVNFNINGVFYTRTTDANGYAKMNINLYAGEYIITAEYKGYMASNKIKVLPILFANDLIMNYHDGSKFTVKLLDGQGIPYANQIITFNINGVFYNRVTDINGQASLNINLDSGNYIITSNYDEFNIANNVIVNPIIQPAQQEYVNDNHQSSNTNYNSQSSNTYIYIGNINSKIFHNSRCSSVERMRNSNKITFNSRDEAISNGYRPCKVCKP